MELFVSLQMNFHKFDQTVTWKYKINIWPLFPRVYYFYILRFIINSSKKFQSLKDSKIMLLLKHMRDSSIL